MPPRSAVLVPSGKTCPVVEYCHFRNSDPPHLLRLWHECNLGRGAAIGFSYETFDRLIFGQPYFDPHGLILAHEGAEVVGFVHAGFECNEPQSGLSHDTGCLAAIMVHPDFRRRGIGRALVDRGENYLQQAGASNLFAGPRPSSDAFYLGLYGGCEAAGFLESDQAAAPFLRAVGYAPCERIAVFQLALPAQRDPVSYRLSLIRRKMELRMMDLPQHTTWWWMTRFGRLDTVQFLLVPKGSRDPVAEITVVGMDLYADKWPDRAVGFINLFVHEQERQKGYGQALMLEVIRRLREERFGLVEAHALETNPGAIAALESIGFARVDTGVVYRKVRNEP